MLLLDGIEKYNNGVEALYKVMGDGIIKNIYYLDGQKAREVCKIPFTPTKGSKEAWKEKRKRYVVHLGICMISENQSFSPAGRLIVIEVQISDEGRIINKVSVKSSQQSRQ